MKRSVKFTLATLIITLVATSSFATTVATVNTNNVTATVVGSCQWVTPLTMAFGNYDPFAGAALTQTTAVNFKCVKLTKAADVYKVWFSKTGGNMVSGGNNLPYTLTQADGVTALPIVAGSAVTVAGVPGIAGAGYSFTVKGSVAPGADVPVGSYSDNVVANIEY